MMLTTFPEIRNSLFEICALVQTLSDDDILNGDNERIGCSYSKLDQLAAMKTTENTIIEILRSDELKTVLPDISRLRNLYGLRLEIEQTKALLASPDPWSEIKGFTFYQNYQKLAEMEHKAAGLEAGNRIVFLGSGPLPLSLIILCSTYDLQGIGIEREKSSADLSRRLIHHLGMANKLSILDGDHFSLPIEQQCNLIMVAAMALPKQDIFNHLAATLSKDSLISYRLYEKGLRKILNLDEPFELPPEFKLHCSIRPAPPVNNTVVVVRHSIC